jgi:catechol 2,3-dioxygenase-like lactoylglutathione lyase family enzyme
MIHHVSLGTNDIERARGFYDPLMKLIGLRLLKASASAAHYGASDIIFSLETPTDGKPATAGNGVHVAFQAPDRETVRRFHATAIRNGGLDDGNGHSAKLQCELLRSLCPGPGWHKIEAVTFTARESFDL